MDRPPLLKPDAAAQQPAGKHSTKAAAEHAALGISDWAALPVPDLLQILHSTDAGLSASGAAAILQRIGPNEVESAKPKSLLSAIVERFSNPLVLILLFAAAVSAFTGDVPSFAIIAAIVLMSVIL
ncbi:MAG: cation-transporting P-type ATPase, partial [Xanthobacteraceae bacterium]